MNGEQQIRRYALHDAVDLEYRLPPALTTRTDNFSPGEEITEHDVAVMTEQARLGEQAVADRVLRHARLFAEYIRSGFDGELELDGLTPLDGDRPAEGDRHGGG